MAYTDSLFQLGMDLTRSSTAQKEDHGRAAHVAHESRKDYLTERDGARGAGAHLVIDLLGAKRLDDLEHIKETLKRCVEVAGATLLQLHLHHFAPDAGVSGVAVLADSHFSVRSWPETGCASFDVFMCGRTSLPLAVDTLKAAFEAERAVVREHPRPHGLEAPGAGAAATSSSGRSRSRPRAKLAKGTAVSAASAR